MADLGHEETDRILKKLERCIRNAYKQAVREVEKKSNDFLAQFLKEDAEKQKLVQSGKMTEKQYKKWRLSMLADGERWQKMKKTLAEDFVNADKIAMKMVREQMPDVYALNHNYAAYEIEHDTQLATSFTLYNHESVERLIRDNPRVLPKPGKKLEKAIAEGKAQLWSQQKLQSIMVQSILQGESIPNIAKRLAETMGDLSAVSAIRNARTMTTAAEAAGRVDAYKRANEMGIYTKQMWQSTLDGRTRHEHRMLDGQVVEVGEPFDAGGVKIRFPGDPSAPGYLIYNCRCRLKGVVKGSDLDLYGPQGVHRRNKLGDMSYEEWKRAKEKEAKKVSEENTKRKRRKKK